MGYKKNKEVTNPFLKRIKDIKTLIPGTSYHIRKNIEKDGNVWKDEAHDIILKEVSEGFLVEESTNAKFSVTEFEIFLRHP